MSTSRATQSADAAGALNKMREAVAAVREGRVEKPGGLRYEGVRAYSVTKEEIRRPEYSSKRSSR